MGNGGGSGQINHSWLDGGGGWGVARKAVAPYDFISNFFFFFYIIYFCFACQPEGRP